ncbi:MULTISPECIES: hypothetical protein [Sandaracinus]|uniref:hypothetical protein n=1 Tax=Sandaracinus TaxID=1055688 RepID=UPI0019D4A2B2|nr:MULTISPECIES: hypothetical protein [Sandaracinus]QRN75789.1 Hypothetical protein MSR10575_88760 [Sandaracinus sp.]UJR87308.1 Hypothetical protein I5071_1000 [Sandaracinus amylolyticus]
MRRVVFDCALRDDDVRARRYRERALSVLVRALAEVNAAYLREHRDARFSVLGDRLASGEDGGEWGSVPHLLATGAAGPIERACWRAADRIVAGRDPAAELRAAEGAAQAMFVGRPTSSIALTVKLFESEAARARSERSLRAMLMALSAINTLYLREYPQTPSLYESGVVYRAEPLPQERWQALPSLIEQGFGDCEDLSCGRVGDLVVREGIQARPDFRFTRFNEQGHVDDRGRFSLYHIVVRRPDGSIEDPSALLGMGMSLEV